MSSYIDMFTEVIKSKYPKATIPSGVAAASSLDSVKKALDETDSQGKSQVLPQFASQIQKILGLIGTMTMGAAAMGGGSSSSSSSSSASTSSVSSMTSDVLAVMIKGFASGLAVTARARGLDLVIDSLKIVFLNTVVIDNLSSDNQSIIIGGVQQFRDKLSQYGIDAYPTISLPSAVAVGSLTPPSVVDYVPDFYFEHFYPQSLDPYPGYVVWEDYFGDILYTKRTSDQPAFAYSSEALDYYVQTAFAAGFDQYIKDKSLTVDSIIIIIASVLSLYLNMAHKTLLGSGSINTASGGSSNLVSQLLPLLSSMIQQANGSHLPNSVLNQDKIKQLLDKHGDASAKARLMVQWAKQALSTGSSAGGSSGLSSILGGM
jgi:hypothetical protein